MRTPLQLTVAARKANSPPGRVNRSMVQGRDCSPLFSTCRTTSKNWIQFRAPLVLERHPSGGTVSVRNTCPVRSSCGTGTCSAWRRKELWGEHTRASCLYPTVRGFERGTVTVVHGGSMTEQVKFETKEVQIADKENLSPSMRAGKQQSRLPKTVA